MKRRAKIVCTLGPATSSPEMVRALIAAGMDVARLNFSHGTREEHAAVYKEVRAAGDAAGRAVALMVDLQGPKIRLGEFEDGGVTLAAGARPARRRTRSWPVPRSPSRPSPASRARRNSPARPTARWRRT